MCSSTKFSKSASRGRIASLSLVCPGQAIGRLQPVASNAAHRQLIRLNASMRIKPRRNSCGHAARSLREDAFGLRQLLDCRNDLDIRYILRPSAALDELPAKHKHHPPDSQSPANAQSCSDAAAQSRPYPSSPPSQSASIPSPARQRSEPACPQPAQARSAR